MLITKLAKNMASLGHKAVDYACLTTSKEKTKQANTKHHTETSKTPSLITLPD